MTKVSTSAEAIQKKKNTKIIQKTFRTETKLQDFRVCVCVCVRVTVTVTVTVTDSLDSLDSLFTKINQLLTKLITGQLFCWDSRKFGEE
jgi:hypothetical protein